MGCWYVALAYNNFFRHINSSVHGECLVNNVHWMFLVFFGD